MRSDGSPIGQPPHGGGGGGSGGGGGGGSEIVCAPLSDEVSKQ
jgi:hypothetical protein